MSLYGLWQDSQAGWPREGERNSFEIAGKVRGELFERASICRRSTSSSLPFFIHVHMWPLDLVSGNAISVFRKPDPRWRWRGLIRPSVRPPGMLLLRPGEGGREGGIHSVWFIRDTVDVVHFEHADRCTDKQTFFNVPEFLCFI